MSNKMYDVLKWITLIGLPAFITFLGVVMNSLHVENADTVLTISTAFNTMLGAMLGVSNINYLQKIENKKDKEEEK